MGRYFVYAEDSCEEAHLLGLLFERLGLLFERLRQLKLPLFDFIPFTQKAEFLKLLSSHAVALVNLAAATNEFGQTAIPDTSEPVLDIGLLHNLEQQFLILVLPRRGTEEHLVA